MGKWHGEQRHSAETTVLEENTNGQAQKTLPSADHKTNAERLQFCRERNGSLFNMSVLGDSWNGGAAERLSGQRP